MHNLQDYSRATFVEFLKLKRTLVFLIVLAVPVLDGLIIVIYLVYIQSSTELPISFSISISIMSRSSNFAMPFIYMDITSDASGGAVSTM